MKKLTILFIIILLYMSLCGCTPSEYIDYALYPTTFAPTIGDKHNDESYDDLALIYNDNSANNLQILPIDNISSDFAMGVDISSIMAVEQAGGVFYNSQGQEQDVLEILHEHGINYIRLRQWHTPYTANGVSYGGGNNDIDSNIAIALRARRVGMRICLDLHYSDFWADPSTQAVPLAWQNMSLDQLVHQVHTYTTDVLQQYTNAGVRPHSVQLGNEINNGLLGITLDNDNSYIAVSTLLATANNAVKGISADIATIIHLAEGASYTHLDYILSNLSQHDTPYDIIGLSYYPYWHGSISQLQYTMNRLVAKYTKPIMIMEYAYGFTDKQHQYCANIFHSSMTDSGTTSIQQQATVIRDIINAVSCIPNNMGIGAFYWEPAWIPVQGAGWASSGAHDYLLANGKQPTNLDKCTWSNQALFSYSGKVLPSMNVFNAIINGD